jgi:membrane protein YqaA with SNARE-associated domain
MFKSIYQKLVVFVRHPAAEWLLALLSFTESCISPLTPMILLIPMCLANTKNKWRYTAVATIAALLGSVCGYLIGHYLMHWFMPFIIEHGYSAAYAKTIHWLHDWGLWMLLPASILIFPPFKLFTIAAGAVSIKFVPFVIVAFFVRLVHFSLVPLLIMCHRVAWLKKWEKKHLGTNHSKNTPRT